MTTSTLLLLTEFLWFESVFGLVSIQAILDDSNIDAKEAMITKSGPEEVIIFDFAAENFTQVDLDDWVESSDTVREPGKSKASFVLQKSKLFQRGVLFALLSPQDNGAGFAGFNVNISLGEYTRYTGVHIKGRVQGQLNHWKVILRHEEDIGAISLVTYESMFELEPENKEFTIKSLPFSDFKAYYRGQEVVDAPPLDLNMVGSFGLQTYGGVYSEFKQEGVGALEIDYITVY